MELGAKSIEKTFNVQSSEFNVLCFLTYNL